MPIEIKYIDGGIGVLYLGKGIVTGEDIINSNKQIFSSEEKMINNKYCLIDYSNVTQFEVSNSEVEIIASQNKKASEYIQDAVVTVVAEKDIEFGMTRMWEMVAEKTGLQLETMVFRAREDAEVWIRERVKEIFGIKKIDWNQTLKI